MRDFPLITVGIPVYNGEQSLTRAVVSVLNQNYPSLRLLIANNASTDKTWSICLNLQNTFSNIEVFNQPKSIDPVDNFNFLLNKASGKYFCWLAHDDEMVSNNLLECVRIMENDSNCVLCSSTIEVVFDFEESYKVSHYLGLQNFQIIKKFKDNFKRTVASFPSPALYGLQRLEIAKRLGGLRKVGPGSELDFASRLSLEGLFRWNNSVGIRYYNVINRVNPVEEQLTSDIVSRVRRVTNRIRGRVTTCLDSRLTKGDKVSVIIFILMFELKEIAFKVLCSTLFIMRHEGGESTKLYKSVQKKLSRNVVEISDLSLYHEQHVKRLIRVNKF